MEKNNYDYPPLNKKGGTFFKKIKKFKKILYEELREEIYDVEDEISKIDSEVLDDIVEPNPEDINEAVHLYTDQEWKRI